MKRNDWKYFVDAVLYVGMSSLAVTGLLLAFVIPSGKVPDASKYFLGIHRHAWGDIHLYVALFLLVIMVLHVWLNWAWVRHWTKDYFGLHWKKVLWAMSAAWLLVLLVGRFFLKP
jgi:hypothetical protein